MHKYLNNSRKLVTKKPSFHSGQKQQQTGGVINDESTLQKIACPNDQ